MSKTVEEVLDNYAKEAGWASKSGGNVEFTRETLAEELNQLLIEAKLEGRKIQAEADFNQLLALKRKYKALRDDKGE